MNPGAVPRVVRGAPRPAADASSALFRHSDTVRGEPDQVVGHERGRPPCEDAAALKEDLP
jgi:hypothetical protein